MLCSVRASLPTMSSLPQPLCYNCCLVLCSVRASLPTVSSLPQPLCYNCYLVLCSVRASLPTVSSLPQPVSSTFDRSSVVLPRYYGEYNSSSLTSTLITCNSCNTGTIVLPDMYTQCLRECHLDVPVAHEVCTCLLFNDMELY